MHRDSQGLREGCSPGAIGSTKKPGLASFALGAKPASPGLLFPMISKRSEGEASYQLTRPRRLGRGERADVTKTAAVVQTRSVGSLVGESVGGTWSGEDH